VFDEVLLTGVNPGNGRDFESNGPAQTRSPSSSMI
jgi:hypothetical protein